MEVSYFDMSEDYLIHVQVDEHEKLYMKTSKRAENVDQASN